MAVPGYLVCLGNLLLGMIDNKEGSGIKFWLAQGSDEGWIGRSDFGVKDVETTTFMSSGSNSIIGTGKLANVISDDDTSTVFGEACNWE